MMAAPVTFDLAIARIRSLSPEEYGENLTVFMDEHPALFGFLLNLSEEFDDDEHEQLVRTAMLLREGFLWIINKLFVYLHYGKINYRVWKIVLE